jgi:phosphonate transport system substrate-binding protein
MYRLSYYPWLTQNVSADEIGRQIKKFADLIGLELQRLGNANPEVRVLPPMDVPAQIDQFVDGGAEIALMNPLGFVFARNRTSAVEAVAVALRIIDGEVGSVYFAQIYTSKKSAIRSLGQAAGRSIGYGVPYSTSNFLIPASDLLSAGVHPLLGFSRVEFLKGHEVIAKAVYNGKIDIGAGHDGVIIDLGNQPGYGDAADQLVQIARSVPIPSDPIAVRIADAGERIQVQQAIVSAGNTAEGKEALKIFWGNTQGLETVATERYHGLMDALTTLKFTEADLLPKR